MARDARDPGHLMGSLLLLSLVINDQGDHERAARLLGAAARLEDDGAAIPPPELIAQMGDPNAEVRRTLSDEAFEAARADGYAMTLDDTVSLALESPGA
jgi:hypothetical protein